MRATTIAVAAIAALGVAAPAAGATTVGMDGNGTIVVTAGPEGNNIGFQTHGDGSGRLVVHEGTATVTSTTSACVSEWEGSVTCDWNPSAGARMDLGGGDDWAYISSDLPVHAPFALFGGPGNDGLQASLDGQPTTLDGGPGDDTIEGGPGSDSIEGGDGRDDLKGAAGSDHVSGGADEDLLSGDEYEGKFADVIDGGAGYDRIEADWGDRSYDAIDERLELTLGGGADDGRPGEGDEVRNVEKVVAATFGRLVGTDASEHLEVFQVGVSTELIGNGGDDRLKGSDAEDTVDGGAGNDDIDAGYGDDRITGGPGRDSISADLAGGECSYLWCKHPWGNDTVDVRDGERDSVSCGTGEDAVNADPVDVVSPDCEQVARDGSGPVVPAKAKRCKTLKGAKRKRCLTKAKRARAIKRCKLTKKGKARARCVSRARKRR